MTPPSQYRGGNHRRNRDIGPESTRSLCRAQRMMCTVRRTCQVGCHRAPRSMWMTNVSPAFSAGSPVKSCSIPKVDGHMTCRGPQDVEDHGGGARIGRVTSIRWTGEWYRACGLHDVVARRPPLSCLLRPASPSTEVWFGGDHHLGVRGASALRCHMRHSTQRVGNLGRSPDAILSQQPDHDRSRVLGD